MLCLNPLQPDESLDVIFASKAFFFFIFNTGKELEKEQSTNFIFENKKNT